MRHTNSFIISLLLHIVLIVGVFFSYEVVTSSFKNPKEDVVCIKLSCISENLKTTPLETKVEKPIKKTFSKKKVEHRRKKIKKETPKPVVKKKQEVVIVEEEEPIESHLVVTPQKSEVVIEEKTKYVEDNLAKIVELLQENLYYPRRARKRGVEGKVVVKFKLSKSAEVSDVRVISSKSEILSRGAIRTIEELSFKFPKPRENLDLSVPIYYKLQ